MPVLIGSGGLVEDSCGNWVYRPSADLTDWSKRGHWLAEKALAFLPLFNGFARVSALEIGNRGPVEPALSFVPGQTWGVVHSLLRSDSKVHDLTFWLALKVVDGAAQETEVEGSWFQIVIYESPFEVDVSLVLHCNAYAGRGALLPADVVKENNRRLTAFLERVEQVPGLEFDYAESAGFKDRIHRYGFHSKAPKT